MAVNKVIYGGNTLVDLTGDTVTAADLADGVKATGADGNPVIGLMQKVTIDAELSTTSTNPVQNKVIKEALDGKLGKNETAASANKLNTNGGSATQPIYFANGVPVATTYTLGKSVPSDAKFTDTVYNHPTTHPADMITGLANVATSGSYNDLTNKPTIVKSVNNVTPDSNGNVTITVSGGGGVSTSESNTWTAAQTFNSISKYKMETLAMLGFNISPTTPSIFIMAESNITIKLDALCTQVAEGESMIFRAYILCPDNGNQYTLAIKCTEANIFITGDITDYAISKWGIILTAYIARTSDFPFMILSATKIKEMIL